MGREGLPFTFSRAGEVRYVTVRRALDSVTMPGARILIIGSRSGMYFFPCAAENPVTVVDPDPGNLRLLEYAKATCDDHLNLKTLNYDPLDLGELSDDSYDVVLLVRTLDNYKEPQDLVRVLAEAVRVTRVGGHVLATFRNRDMIPITRTIKDPAWFASRFYDPEIRDVAPSVYGAHTLGEARDILRCFPLDTVAELSADGHAAVIEEYLDQMPEEAYTNYLAWHLEHCEGSHGLDAAENFLFVCRKSKNESIAYWDDAATEAEIAAFARTPFHFRGHFFKGLTLEEGPVSLVLERTTPAFPERGLVPAYAYRILHNGRDAGIISLRLGYNAHLYYVGHLGYRVYKGFRGRGIAGIACRLIGEVAKRHEMPFLAITNDVRNAASIRVCEKLGAEKKRTLLLPPDQAVNLDQNVTNVYYFKP